MENKELWFVGTDLADDRWMVEGAYFTEEEAVAAANCGEFVLLAEIGSLPPKITGAKKLYRPSSETWKESYLYNLRKHEIDGYITSLEKVIEILQEVEIDMLESSTIYNPIKEEIFNLAYDTELCSRALLEMERMTES